MDYAFVSNMDNLGATFDEKLLGYFVKKDLPFLMEVTIRSKADSKGGHLARMKQGGLILREIAQCPEEELESFQNINIYKYFNTNSIWINLKKLKQELGRDNQVLPLAMIRNPKPLNPRDEKTPPVYQVETAMGSAISLFEGAEAICVPRSRYAPVKTCRDLLVVWSDVYTLTEQYDFSRLPGHREKLPLVELDSRYYRKIDDLKERFPYGAPSLLECQSFTVKGDVVFGKDVVIKGTAVITNTSQKQITISNGSIIKEDLTF
jgi:UTP--glucose-1-phosphate uridylyltransferase